MWMEPVGDRVDGAACFADMGGFDGFNGGGNCNETGIDICDDWDGWERSSLRWRYLV